MVVALVFEWPSGAFVVDRLGVFVRNAVRVLLMEGVLLLEDVLLREAVSDLDATTRMTLADLLLLLE
jgi:hypothetical protein